VRSVREGRDLHSEPFAWRRKRYREWLCGASRTQLLETALAATEILPGAEATRECWAARMRAVASGFGGLKDPLTRKDGADRNDRIPMAVGPGLML
jgi:hypothetical protein